MIVQGLAILALIINAVNLVAAGRAHHHIGRALRARQQSPGYGRAFKLQSDYSNSTFFDAWNFFAHPDPTHGTVNYLDQASAMNGKNGQQPLAYINRRGNPVIRVDHINDLPYGQNRDSVRITSKETFKKGQLLLLDARHMPTGCSTWPAFWTVGAEQQWPYGGEIDIVEGVNVDVRNQYTLHTKQGCQTTTPMQAVAEVVDADCNVWATPFNLGCGNKDPNTRTFGSGFNKIGGGVFATLWDDSGITIYFFPRNQIPQDVLTGNPMPQTWAAPRAHWANDGCNTDDFFDEQTIIINTTLCGTWAGADNVYPMSGCPGTCQSNIMTAHNFKRAYWEINYVRIYSPTWM